MSKRFWPLYGPRITTPRPEPAVPDGEVLDELAGVAADGIGTEMRAAVPHPAFEGLGARHVTSAAPSP